MTTPCRNGRTTPACRWKPVERRNARARLHDRRGRDDRRGPDGRVPQAHAGAGRQVRRQVHRARRQDAHAGRRLDASRVVVLEFPTTKRPRRSTIRRATSRCSRCGSRPASPRRSWSTAIVAESGGGLAAYRAVGTLYNALMTALMLGLVTRRGEDTAREYVFRHFRRQHLEKFLPGLQKLGLADEPDAPACALYHYHSNALGGVKTGYLRESDSKAWVRYPPPRWIWRGTAIAAVPHAVSAAMLHGWHGHNGVSLGNPGPGLRLHRHDGRRHAGPGRLLFRLRPAARGGRARALRLRHGGDAARRLGQPAQARDRELARGTAPAHLPRLRAGIPAHHAADPAGAARPRRRAEGTRPRGAPGRPAVPRGDGARHGPADRRRARRPAKRLATSRAGCRRSWGPQGEEIETTERDGAVTVRQPAGGRCASSRSPIP